VVKVLSDKVTDQEKMLPASPWLMVSASMLLVCNRNGIHAIKKPASACEKLFIIGTSGKIKSRIKHPNDPV